MIRTMRGFRAGCSLFGSSWLAGQGRMVLSQGLFRQEVIDARRGEWLGSIIVAAPLSRWLLTALASVLATTILLFLLLGHYTRRETVAGQLVPSAGLLNVVAPDAGTITRLNVRDGHRVRKGEVLLRLSSEQDSAALGDTHALVGRQLDVQRSRLQADLVNQQQLGEQQGEALSGAVGVRDRLRRRWTERFGQDTGRKRSWVAHIPDALGQPLGHIDPAQQRVRAHPAWRDVLPSCRRTRLPDRLAELLQSEILASTDLLDCRSHPKSWELLRSTRMPAVRVEMGYLTNPGDAARLTRQEFRDTIAEAIVIAVQRLYAPTELPLGQAIELARPAVFA